MLKDGNVSIAVGGITAECSQFATEKEAKQFLKTHKLYKLKNVTISVISNEQLIKKMPDGVYPLDGSLFYIESQDGKFRIFYHTQAHHYYAGEGDVGYCCWKDRKSAQDFIDTMDPIQGNQMVIKEIKQDLPKA